MTDLELEYLKNGKMPSISRTYGLPIGKFYNYRFEKTLKIWNISSYSISYMREEAGHEYKDLSKMARNAPRTPYVKSFLSTCPNYCLENESDIRAFKA